jgi:hypothetical protein
MEKTLSDSELAAKLMEHPKDDVLTWETKMEPTKTLKAREIAALLMEHPEDEVYTCNEQGWFPVGEVGHGPEKWLVSGPSADDSDDRTAFSIS